MDESSDPKPHPYIPSPGGVPHMVAPDAQGHHKREELSIWFFCGILMLAYGIVLLAQGVYEHFGHQPPTVLANLEPTFWWGLLLFLSGAFYTLRFRPR